MGEGLETIMFIGGCADGQRRRVRPGENVIKATSMVKGRALYAGPMFAGTDQSSVTHYDYYERATLTHRSSPGPNAYVTSVSFFRLQGMTEIDAVRRLIAHYKPT